MNLESSKDAERSGAGRMGRGPAAVVLAEVEPWPEPVSGELLLDDIAREVQRFVVFPQWGAETAALWILHTYAFEWREVSTYLGIESPEKECGKSTLVTVLSQFVNRAAVSSNISSSAFFRAIEELRPTLLIDEADTNLRGKDDLSGILNAGYTRQTAYVWRMCYDGGGEEPEKNPRQAGPGPGGRVARYSCWCPKAIAAIGRLRPTLASRCVVIRMQRKMAGEGCERLKRLRAGDLKRQCARFVADYAAEIRTAEPLMPAGLGNRAADVWEPLLVLADLAGGRWPELARAAAKGLTAQAQERSPMGALLMDIFLAFVLNGKQRLFSRQLVEWLQRSEGRPWGELGRSRVLTENWLAQQLRPYGIRPRTVRMGEETGRGYEQEDFLETFRRYIPRGELERLKSEAQSPRCEVEGESPVPGS